jgi:hypothetical protein
MKIEVSDITEPKYKLSLELSKDEAIRLQAVVGSVFLNSDKAIMFLDIFNKLKDVTEISAANIVSGVLHFKDK